ncbi:LysE family translocator [Thermomonospora catenispora]|uniref:LysE family translocator n=1 Tax=Thermomonospora catenispora TaxID=2493090 RepID=UPI00111F81E8|nr:LysE family transporter [Thermomonospora catenispora]TNY35925.1 LysE family translocator [Thermomonospora catenispora]
MRELVLGLTIGLGSGVSPGPLLALVISTTMRGGRAAGMRAAASPLVTDLPVIALALTVLSLVPGWALSAAGVAGGLFVLTLGVSTLREARSADLPRPQGEDDPPPSAALWQGVVVNLLSPHPWLFWMSIGGPILTTAWQRAPVSGAAFLIGFYLTLVGGKAALALLLGSVRQRLNLTWYRRRLLGLSGVLLVGAAAALLAEFLPWPTR